jgi:hypothetical protein
VEENQCSLIVKFTFFKLDEFNRKTYKCKNGVPFKGIYKMVNGVIHYCTKDGEPVAPTEWNYEIIKDYKGADHTSN